MNQDGSVFAGRVLVLHNRYRIEGGEERSVELHVRALEEAQVPWQLVERRSAESSRVRSGVALLAGGSDLQELAAAVRRFEPAVVHAHNIHPLIGPRALAATRRSGTARIVLHLHNVRLFCAIGVASRDREPCPRCRGRRTLPGLLLNCRGSVPEAVAYATGLALHQPTVWKAVDRFVTPSRHGAEQLAGLGVPSDRLTVLPHYLPAEAFAGESRADRGRYALVVGRLSEEKGIDVAIEAAAATGVPMRIAGDGPLAEALNELARRRGAPARLLGRLDRAAVTQELAGAAMLVLPSRYHEFAPYAVLEAMAAGVPVVGTALGGVPELVGLENCVPPNDAQALAARISSLWTDGEVRRSQGELLLAKAREQLGAQRYRRDLLRLYAEVCSPVPTAFPQ